MGDSVAHPLFTTLKNLKRMAYVTVYSTKVAAQLAVLCVFVLYHVAFVSFGISSMIVDISISQDSCGKSTHLWKYSMLNVIFSVMTLITFTIFPGGGEGARARALMITILHLGFVVWGILLWSKLPECLDIVSAKHRNIYFFHVVCVWHNAVFLFLYIFHEMYLGEKLGGDLTLMPEVQKQDIHDYSYVGALPDGVSQADAHMMPVTASPPSPSLPTPAPSGGIPPKYMPGGLHLQHQSTPPGNSPQTDKFDSETPQRGL